MKFSLKWIVSIVVVLLLFGVNMEVGYAQVVEKMPPPPTEGTPSKDLTEGCGEIPIGGGGISPQARDYLIGGTCYISYDKGNTVIVSSRTSAYNPVDTIGLVLYLQRWDASKGRWVDVVNLGELKAVKQSYVQMNRQVTIVKGHYYRTRSINYVIHNGKLEQGQCVSSYIYIPN